MLSVSTPASAVETCRKLRIMTPAPTSSLESLIAGTSPKSTPVPIDTIAM
jgi:hypothetical protein